MCVGTFLIEIIGNHSTFQKFPLDRAEREIYDFHFERYTRMNCSMTAIYIIFVSRIFLMKFWGFFFVAIVDAFYYIGEQLLEIENANLIELMMLVWLIKMSLLRGKRDFVRKLLGWFNNFVEFHRIFTKISRNLS